MQDRVPSHRPKSDATVSTTEHSRLHADGWASYFPDLSRLDYCIWDILQDLFYEDLRLPFINLQDLKETIKKKWKGIITETVRESICAVEWEKRLNAVRKKNGGVIQHIFR